MRPVNWIQSTCGRANEARRSAEAGALVRGATESSGRSAAHHSRLLAMSSGSQHGTAQHSTAKLGTAQHGTERRSAAHPVARVLQPVVEPLLLDVGGHPVRLLVVGQQLHGRERVGQQLVSVGLCEGGQPRSPHSPAAAAGCAPLLVCLFSTAWSMRHPAVQHTHTALLCRSRSPHLWLDLLHAHEPGGHGLVDEGGVGAPAEGVGVHDGAL